MTSRKELFFDKIVGMDYGRPDQVQLTNWRRQHNFRWFNGSLQQTERKKVETRISPGFHAEFVHIDTIPTSVAKRNACFGLTKEGIYTIRPQRLAPTTLATPTKLQLNGRDFSFNHTELYSRWDVTHYNGHAYFVNPQNSVYYTDGSTLYDIPGDVPAGRYVEVFYDHLVVAGPVVNGIAYPSRMAFSALYNFGLFKPDTTNEACTRDVTDYDNNRAIVEGITGMKRLGNQLITYTDSTIYTSAYVGLPHVINTNPLIEGVGNSLHNGVVTTDEAHFFFSIRNRQFYRLSGEGLKPIGNPIAEYWFPLLENNNAREVAVHGYHDPFYKEIWWVLADDTDDWEDQWPQFRRAVVYNYANDTWYTASLEDVHCFGQVSGFAKRYDDLVNLPYDQLKSFGMRDIGTTTQTNMFRLWGSRYGRILRETSTKSLALAVSSSPFLETKDYNYGDIGTVKELDQITLAASGQMNVEVAVRTSQGDSLVWQSMGTWSPGDLRMSSNKKSGVIFRFRFTPVTTTDFVDTVVQQDASQTQYLSLYDSAFNGPVTAMAVRSDGKIYIAGEFTKYKNTNVPRICRLNIDGTLDTTFNVGAGFVVDATYSPPTQLVVSATGGVWCSLSYSRLIELIATRNYSKLFFQGAERSPVIRIGATGTLERDEVEVALGGDTVNVGGIAVDGTDLFVAYVRIGPSTSNFWHTSIAKTENDVLFRRRTMVSNGGLAGGFKLPDVAIQGNQIIWSCPRSTAGTIVDVLREDGVSILNASDYGKQRDITYYVANKKLILQDTWVNAAFNPDVGLSNPIVLGGRMEPGGLNNVYASYLPDTGSFFNGRFGHTSKPYHHRGLYQFKLGELDHYTDPVEGVEESTSFFISYPQTFGTIWDPLTVNVGNTAKKVTFTVSGSGCVFNVVYNGVNLFGGPLMVGSNDLNDPNGTSGTITRTVSLNGSDATIDIDGYFNIFDATNGVTTFDITWTLSESSGGTLIGTTYPHGWQIGDSDLATAGFELSSLTVDADNKTSTVQPLVVVGDDKAENVYVNGAIKKFKGVTVPTSALWKVSNAGVMDMNFAVRVINNWLSADGVQRKGKIYCAVKYGEFILIGGRFTQVNDQSSQHIALIKPSNGEVVGQIVTTPKILSETVTTGGGVVGFRYYQYSQHVYTIAAER